MTMKLRVWILIILAAAAAGAGGWRLLRKPAKAVAYRMANVERGDLAQTVRATGTVQPIKLVQVGTQVNGPVKKLYVDFNDQVRAGDLVAQIDPIVYQARLAQDKANLLQSEASVESARAKLEQADKDLARSRELAKRDLLSQSDLDAAVANRDALAAQEKVARAAVEQSKASLQLSQANLDYTTIRSPVDGVVIQRAVDEGQTVVASMSAQTLFQIATDLRRVQVTASIPEADIGKVRTNQTVTFAVDAYDEDYRGTVSQVRMSAATVQNVVTYPVVILADNPDLRLFPGMTANIACEVARREGVLKVPNAALRFKPENQNQSQDQSRAAGASGQNRPAGRPARASAAGGQQSEAPRAKVWIRERPGAPPVAVPIRTGITDGSFTEVIEPTSLAEGQAVITGIAEAGKQEDVVNPFTPQMPRGRRGPPGPR
jgi:HlyD family secretion protein